jgi:glutathione S-transferase
MVELISTLENPARLITIPVSHYCEKTRWALERLKIPFVEEPHMPPFHRFATRRIGKRLEAAPETERNMSWINRFVIQQVGGQSVPILRMPAGTLRNSDEILKGVDALAPNALKLYPTNLENRRQVEDLVHSFDSILGPAVRLWTYFYMMEQPHLLKPLWCQGVPWFERLLFPVVFPWMRANVVQMYNINEVSAIAAHELICKTFERVDHLLADNRTYLVGDYFSAADLTFASLAAAVVIPVGYGVNLPDVRLLPPSMAISIQQFRQTAAGKFVLQIYQERIGQSNR